MQAQCSTSYGSICYLLVLPGQENIRTFNNTHFHYEQEGLVQFVIDSVNALAIAIDNLLKSCPYPPKVCIERGYVTGEEVLHHIRNVTFKGIS